MTSFFRTVTGKTLSFILCLIAIIITLSSVALAAVMLGTEMYTQSESSIVQKATSHLYLQKARGVIATYEDRIRSEQNRYGIITVPEEDNFIFELSYRDRVVLRSSQADKTKDWVTRVGAKAIGNRAEMVYFHYKAEDDVHSDYLIKFALPENLPHLDSIRLMTSAVKMTYGLKYAIYPIGILSALIALTFFLILIHAAGRIPNSEELHPGILHKIPYDLLLFAEIIGFLIPFFTFRIPRFYSGPIILLPLGILGILLLCTALGMCMSAAVRIKDGSFFKNTVVYRILQSVARAAFQILHLLFSLLNTLFSGAARCFRNIRIAPKFFAALVLFSVIEFILIAENAHDVSKILLIRFTEKLFVLPLLFAVIYALNKLEKSGKALAAGNLSHHTDHKGLFWNFKTHADHLNSIAKGMSLAIEDRLKSERMKTELITNVSHDIKTPLTSIINYSSLIAQENRKDSPDQQVISEYADILFRQSEKLKTLVEDLVEASKASTGNLEINLAPTDAALYLPQICGEYADRLESTGLTPVVRSPESAAEIFIMADSRRMWRIFDNLMNNICKYALPGTRVYLNLEANDEQVVFTMKNTSAEALNLSEDELFERFVRGDRSRNTEGSGLGLSITKSLVELQGGTMKIETDGDLFKAVLRFPRTKYQN